MWSGLSTEKVPLSIKHWSRRSAATGICLWVLGVQQTIFHIIYAGIDDEDLLCRVVLLITSLLCQYVHTYCWLVANDTT